MSMIQRLKERFLERFGQDEDRFYKQIKEKFSVVGNLVGVTELVEKAAQLFSDDIALIDQERILTYKELYARALSVSEKLSQVGVKSKDNVLLYCENSIEFYIFYYAIWLRGAVVVPMNTFLHEKELAYIIGDANPSAILTLSSMKPKLETLVSGGHLAELAPMITEKAISLGECDKNVKPLGLDELCLLLYTSGTTGKPKGVMLSSRNVITNAMQDYARLRMFSKQKERVFAVLPLFHVFAQNTCMWLPLLTGSSVVVVKKIDRRHITEGLQKNPTLFFGFPALFGLLCLMKTAPLESIKR
ncbi:acyl--CoA ligase, partial [Candidatus Babeliales bacterium]|nr:acyl--CoA ligase [Candidatus Babeliales bacterium]